MTCPMFETGGGLSSKSLAMSLTDSAVGSRSFQGATKASSRRSAVFYNSALLGAVGVFDNCWAPERVHIFKPLAWIRITEIAGLVEPSVLFNGVFLKKAFVIPGC